MDKADLRLLGDYVTQNDHGDYPAGSKCVAYRNKKGLLTLEMQDGGFITFGPEVYAKDLEPPPDAKQCGVWGSIYREEDEGFIRAIDEAIKWQAR